ncbi:signal peptidase I [Leuconostocaceae bacterium ESL0958]|nr:signal peptidase I [Leuconostocaceae bacterium ESL0958]
MKKTFRFLWNWVAPIAFGFLVFWAVTTFWISTVTISGDSMTPNLLNAQQVVVRKTHSVKRGDVVVFDARKEDPRIQPGKKDYVKRVIAVAGDTVEYRDGELLVNGKKVDQHFISQEEQLSGTQGQFGSSWSLESLSNNNLWQDKDRHKSKVPAGSYFVLGDHRSVSNDGRYFGFVDADHVVGRVIVPFWYSDTVKSNVNRERNHFFA